MEVPAAVAELFASGRPIDCILILMLLELVVLALIRRSTQGGLKVTPLLTNLGAGAALLMSLRAALTRQTWQIITVWLIVALVAHAVDLKLRWAVK
jgi:preprotein translocase subunit SecG